MNTYTTVYEKNETTRQGKLKGRVGTLIRLIVMGLLSLLSFLISFGTLPGYSVKLGLWQATLEAFSGCGLLLVTIAFFWGFAKWIVMVAPKSFGFASRMWCGWETWTIFGLYLKSVLWLLVGAVPCMIFGLPFSLIFGLGFRLALNGLNFFSATAMFLAGIVLVVIMAVADICKLFRFSPVALVKEKLFGRK